MKNTEKQRAGAIAPATNSVGCTEENQTTLRGERNTEAGLAGKWIAIQWALALHELFQHHEAAFFLGHLFQLIIIQRCVFGPHGR